MATTEARNFWNFSNNKTLIISITVIVLFIIIMYFRDRQQQNVYELRRLEKRVEMLEEWGIQQQQAVR